MREIFNASYIKAPVSIGDVCPIFKKQFNVSNAKRVQLQVTSLGVYHAKINGKKVSEYVLAPGWTVYSKRLQYQTYDITSYIAQDNMLEIGVGLGWRMHPYGLCIEQLEDNKEVALIASIVVEDADGNITTYNTDSSWDVYTGNITYSNIYNGETLDANIEETFVSKAIEIDCTKDILIAQEGEEIREIETISAKEIITTPNGDTVIDFGQNLTGYLQFNIKGNKGEEAIVLHAEVLDKNGEFYTGNLRSAKQQITFICDGTQRVFKPTYTFMGFRYIKLIGFSDEIKLENFKAIVVHSQLKRTGHFECSSPMLNQLYKNIIWGQKGNFLDVPTDCPQRDERLGWTGDAQVFIRTASYNYDVNKFFKKWLADLAADQEEDGRVPHVIPKLSWWSKESDPSSAWADATVICPWQLYLTYANKDILQQQYDSMKKWIDFVSEHSTDNLWLGMSHFGDWLSIEVNAHKVVGGTNHDLIASAFYAYSTSLFIKIGKVLGVDTSEYEQLLTAIKKAYVDKFIDNGKMVENTQTACVLTIYFNLYEDIASIGEQLVDIVESVGHMTTGFVGTPYLLHALTMIGRSDLAYKLILREEYPSWLYSVKRGATTIWEHWDGINEQGDMWSDEMNSFNHYAYGAVGDWMYGVMAGINTDENAPGFKHIIFKPVVSELISYVKASIDTCNGLVKSEWVRENGKVKYTFTVPSNSVATVHLNGDTIAIGAGEHSFLI